MFKLHSNFKKLEFLFILIINTKESYMKDYHIFLVATEDYCNELKLLFCSMKHWKKEQSNYIIHLYLDSQKIEYYKQYFKNIQTDTFKIDIKSSIPYKYIMNFVKENHYSYLVNMKLLVPKLFPELDKILILDCDTLIINSGLEELLDDNIDDYYAGGVLDIPIFFGPKLFKFGWEQKKQCQTQTYFNCGLIYLNLKKIREDNKDFELLQAAIKYPENLKCLMYEQTVFNYIFRNKVKLVDPKFNNFTTMIYKRGFYHHNKQLYKMYNYKSLEDLLGKTVMVHFTGIKPWKKIKDGIFQDYPKFHIALEIYNKNKEMLKREMED